MITITEKDDRTQLVLEGALDLFAVDELYQAAHALLEKGEDLVLSCEKAQRFDASTLQILLALKKALSEKGTKMQVSSLAPALEQHLSLAGLSGAFS